MDETQDFAVNLQDSKAEYVLSNVAEVVERILTFVPTKSLLRLASVCRLWRNCARRVVRTQQNLAWVSACGPTDRQAHALSAALEEEVEKVFVLPKTVLAMADSDAFDGFEDYYNYRQRKAKKSRRNSETAEELAHFFPKGCEILGINAFGIVLTPSGSGVRHPKEYQSGEAGFAVLLPGMEGVNVKPFHFCRKSMSPTSLKEAGLVDNPDLRVVMLFVYENHFSGEVLDQVLDPLAKSKALIIGGLVEKVFTPKRRCCGQGSAGVVGLALSGPKVQGASVLLDEEVTSPKAAEATIRRLKAAKIPERNTVGLMFACLGRGQSYYMNVPNVEADAFRAVFPNIPLFGFFGNGEFGCDRIVKDDYTLCETDIESLRHTYTTVMSLVHLG